MNNQNQLRLAAEWKILHLCVQKYNDRNSFIPILAVASQQTTTGIPSTLTISCDNVIDALYLDGQQTSVDNPTDWRQVGHVDVPAGTNTVAVQCTDHGVVYGLIASSSSGLVTDGSGSWRCTSTLETDWLNPGFDDSLWPTAVVKGDNDGISWSVKFPGMGGAKWIWSSSQLYSTVYCRAKF